MKWKLVLAVILILGIVGLLFVSESTSGLLGLLKRTVGDFTSVLFKWVPGGKQFSVTLTTDNEIFYGQLYKVSNSTFESSGSIKELKINDASSPVEQANIKIEGMKGNVEITRHNTVKISADAEKITLNSLPILNLNIFVEMAPSTFSLTYFNTDKLIFTAVNGKIKTEEGWARDLKDTDLELDGFKGSLKFEGNQAVLEGIINKLVVDGKEITIVSK